MEQEIINKMQAKLLAEKKRLQRLLHTLSDSDDPEHIPGKDHDVKYEDIGTDTGATDENVHERENYEVALAAAGSLEDQLVAVDAAMERIDRGTYGVCDNCDNEIPEARLEANPAATICIDCSEHPGQ